MHETNNSGKTRPSTGTGSFGLILVLLLLALLAFSFWYTGPDGRTYGDAALQDAQEFTAKVVRKAKRVYHCAVQGCKNKPTQEAIAPAPATEPEANTMAQAATPATATEPTAPAATSPSAAASSPATTTAAAPATAEAAAPPVFRTNPILPPGVLSNSQAPKLPAEAAGTPLAAPTPEPAMLAPAPQNLSAPTTAPQAYVPFSNPQVSVSNAGPVLPPATPAAVERAAQPVARQLLSARRSLQEHRYQDAIALYRKQLAETPDNIDAYGELGNTLLLVQRHQEAAQSYYEAATRLLDAGLADSAMRMLPVIEQYEPILAGLLRTKAARLGR